MPLKCRKFLALKFAESLRFKCRILRPPAPGTAPNQKPRMRFHASLIDPLHQKAKGK